ncbi:MAG: cytochrome c oxidase subunit 2A [Deinococcaceae bacterium]
MGDKIPRGTFLIVGTLVLSILLMWFLVYGLLEARA